MSIEEYYQKRKLVQEKEAMELVKEYRKVFNKNPEEKHLHEFFWLFSNGNDDIPECWKRMLFLGGDEMCTAKFKRNKKKYSDMEIFLKTLESQNEKENMYIVNAKGQ